MKNSYFLNLFAGVNRAYGYDGYARELEDQAVVEEANEIKEEE